MRLIQLIIILFLVNSVIAQYTVSKEFYPGVNYSEGDVKIVDLDNDGLNDVIYSGGFGGNVGGWYRNLGNGTFDSGTTIGTGAISTCIVAADVSGDGLKDVFISYFNGDKVCLYLNLGGGIFSSEVVITDSLYHALRLHCDDLDGDNDTDIVCMGTHETWWYENDGAGNFTSGHYIDNGGYYDGIDTYDINGDNRKDILLGNLFYYQQANGSFVVDQVLTTGIYQPTSIRLISVHFEDMDNDGDMDIVGGNFNDYGIFIYYNNANVFSAPQRIDNYYDVRCVRVDDIDLDGDKDVLFGGWYKHKLYIMENVGGCSFVKHIYQTTEELESIDVGDLDNDGDKEIAYATDLHARYFGNLHFSNYQFTGEVFYDVNQNKIRDPNETGLPFLPLNLNPGSGVLDLGNDGDYIFNLDTGHYSLSIDTSMWKITTDSLNYNRFIDGANPVHNGLDFGMCPDTVYDEIFTNLSSQITRCDELNNISLFYKNTGTTFPDCVIELETDPLTLFNNATVSPDSIVGNKIYWHHNSLTIDTSVIINAHILYPASSYSGDSICHKFTVFCKDSSGNISSVWHNENIKILDCITPSNKKEVVPIGVGLEHFIIPEDTLFYTVQIQNTGADTVNNVLITDNLHSWLDYTTVEVIGSSHNVSVSNYYGTLNFMFNNIELPDSLSNPQESIVYVSFKVAVIPGCPPGTIIENYAEIIFDGETSIVTDTVFNTIYDCSHSPDIKVNAQSICKGEKLTAWSDEPEIISYNWEIGTQTDLSDTLNWTIDTSGVLPLTLTVSNSLCFIDTTVDITIHETYMLTDTVLICPGDSIMIYGVYQSDTGTYYDLYSTVNGCDSIYVTTLMEHPVFTTNNYTSICPDDSIFVIDQYLQAPGIYYDTLNTIYGCDSVIITDLSHYSSYYFKDTLAVCQGDSIWWQDSYYMFQGTYFNNDHTTNGCDSIYELELIENARPQIGIIFGADTVDLNQVEVYYILPDTLVCHWFVNNGNIISYLSNNSVQVQWSNIGSGDLYVILEDTNSCFSDTAMINVIIGATYSDYNVINNIVIYPNPTTGEFTIEGKGIEQIEIMNVNGQTILSQPVANGNFRNIVDLSDKSKGIYFIKVTTTEGVAVEKVVLE